MGTKFRALGAGLVLAFLATITLAGPASATTVPNRFYCKPNGGWCYQVNGAFVPGIFTQCHWNRGNTSGKPNTMYYTNCNSWGQDVWT